MEGHLIAGSYSFFMFSLGAAGPKGLLPFSARGRRLLKSYWVNRRMIFLQSAKANAICEALSTVTQCGTRHSCYTSGFGSVLTGFNQPNPPPSQRTPFSMAFLYPSAWKLYLTT